MPSIAYGGDYNPEQWPEDVWREDVRLMGEAGVNLVTVGVFSWALLEPSEGVYDLAWLDRVMDLLEAGGIGVDLATGTASPPPWMSVRYPASLPERPNGTRLWWGSRQAFCPSSPEYRRAACNLVDVLARRYSDHPGLRLWHIHNEYGCHNGLCYCDTTAAAFRDWLTERYGDVETLNDAWTTSFWGQRYGTFDEVVPPRQSTAFRNPALQLDFARFSSGELLACLKAEKEVLRRHCPTIPVTTNLLSFFKQVDSWELAPELDVVANDHYLINSLARPQVDLAMAADLTRSLAGGAPWLLMEHSTSAVNWQPRNLAKAPRQMRRNTLTHVARGADGAMFFQWRASKGGAEKFHSAMVPHAGTDSRIWREVCALGRDLAALGEVAGSRVGARVAVVFDWPSWWAGELEGHPSMDLSVLDQVRRWYGALWDNGYTCDFVQSSSELAGYDLVVAPSLYLVDDAGARAIAERAAAGGVVAIAFFSGIVDRTDSVRLGGYPGAFRDLLGIKVEEFYPLARNDTILLSDGSSGRIWSELGAATTAEVKVAYAEGPVAGSPAITRRAVPGAEAGTGGAAWYLGTVLDEAAMRRFVVSLCDDAGVEPEIPGFRRDSTSVPDELEIVTRHTSGRAYTFVVNHGPRSATVPISGFELLTGTTVDGALTVATGDVCVVRVPA